jgi:hypothetical protein
MTPSALVNASTTGGADWAQGHLLHIAAAAVFFLVTVGGVALSELPARANRRSVEPLVRTWHVDTVAAAVAGAATLHYLVTPEHFREAWILGTFFLVTATAQLGYAALLLRHPTRPLLVAGVVANLGVVLLWIYTRTEAIPFGIGEDGPESFGVLDIVSSSLECIAVLGGGWLLVRGGKKQTRLSETKAPH